MEGYETSTLVGKGWGIFGGCRSWSSGTSTVPEEYTDEDEKKTSECADNDPSNGSSTKP